VLICPRCNLPGTLRHNTSRGRGAAVCHICGRILHYAPTPWEIAAECKQIQAGWTEAERRRRQSQVVEPLEVERVTVARRRGSMVIRKDVGFI